MAMRRTTSPPCLRHSLRLRLPRPIVSPLACSGSARPSCCNDFSTGPSRVIRSSAPSLFRTPDRPKRDRTGGGRDRARAAGGGAIITRVHASRWSLGSVIRFDPVKNYHHRMSSTDKAEDAATEGYTVGDDVPVASSGSPDHTTTSTTTSNDHNPAHSIASVQAETVQTKDDPPATPATPTSPAAGDDSVTPPAPAANEASAVEGAAPEDDGPVGYLKSMFPEMDTETLEAVLAAHGGSVENAIEALLAMSDPSAAPPQANSAQTTVSLIRRQYIDAWFSR